MIDKQMITLYRLEDSISKRQYYVVSGNCKGIATVDKGMTNLFELKSIVGLDDSKNSVLVTLVDGRCALVDLKKRVFVVEILLDSFYKWMEFPNSPSKDNLESVKKILEHPEGVGYGPLAEKYVVYPKIKRDFDQIKKEAGYHY